MKHQALARVFAVVLAIMCLLMLLNGATGFGKAAKAHEERTAFEEKYAQQIENYVTLHEQVENSISYDEAYELLKEKLEQHDKDAAQHRTDTALYTAEKGGNTMGANLIWEAMPEIAAAKQELAKAKKQFEDVQTAYNGVKGDLQDIAAQAQSDADESGMDAAQMQQLAQEFAALLNTEPRLPEGFFIPEDHDLTGRPLPKSRRRTRMRKRWPRIRSRSKPMRTHLPNGRNMTRRQRNMTPPWRPTSRSWRRMSPIPSGKEHMTRHSTSSRNMKSNMPPGKAR